MQRSKVPKKKVNQQPSLPSTDADGNNLKKDVFSSFELADLDGQHSFGSFSTTDSLNVSTDCKNAFSGKDEENAILDDRSEMSNRDDDIFEPIAISGPASNLSEGDKKGTNSSTIQSDDSLKDAKTVDKKAASG